MKARIIGTILLLVVLAGLFVLTEDGGNKQPNAQPSAQQSEPAFQPLKIN